MTSEKMYHAYAVKLQVCDFTGSIKLKQSRDYDHVLLGWFVSLRLILAMFNLHNTLKVSI